MSENYLVLDIETRDSFLSAGSYDASKLHVSLVGVYYAQSDQYTTYLEDQLTELWPAMLAADRVIGFNLFGFDYPVLQNYFPGSIKDIPTLDIMYEFKKTHGFRIKLDSIAQENLGVGKSGDGLKAIRLWEQGKIDELKAYCLDDVKITRDLFLKGIEEGVLYFTDKGLRKTWMVDWALKKLPDPPLTLGF